MRKFSYFLFENFEADEHAENPKNPRRFLNSASDAVLSYVADYPTGLCRYDACVERFDVGQVVLLIEGGILRHEKGCIKFDSPIILREDVTELRKKMNKAAARLTNVLSIYLPDIRSVCSEINNGFSVEENLYHILCGMIFDGTFFDYLEKRNSVAVSRLHPSGLDYIAVIYEKCPQLDAYSNGLLCSYNRFTDGHCALQSFGDANGERYDFYRFFRCMEANRLSNVFHPTKELLESCYNIGKEEILLQVKSLITQGTCSTYVLTLLEHFSYVKNGEICVPVFTAVHKAAIDEVAKVVETNIGEQFAVELSELSEKLDLTAVRHGVAMGEIANELYHILFGSVNEELVKRGFVTEPLYIPGEGRYRKSIQLI